MKLKMAVALLLIAAGTGLSAPAGRGASQAQGFICFEPMAAITNALNMAQRGLYKELQSIPPGGVWKESFWIRPSGF